MRLRGRLPSTNKQTKMSGLKRASLLEVLEGVLEGWEGEPEQLFSIELWRRRIRNELLLARVPSDGELNNLVASAMDLAFDESRSHYFESLEKGFSRSQRARFRKLRAEYAKSEATEQIFARWKKKNARREHLSSSVGHPRPPSAPALTQEMLSATDAALSGPEETTLVEGFSLTLRRGDLAPLSTDGGWLIDHNVDFFLGLVEERSEEDGYPSVKAFRSFLYPMLRRGFAAAVTEHVAGELARFDLLLIPVNWRGHWRLVVGRVDERLLECYDSLGLTLPSDISFIEDYLVEMMGGGPWTIRIPPKEEVPQQGNGSDCGVFMLQFADYVSREMPFDFTQAHMPYFRKRMTYEILTKQLLPSDRSDMI